MDPKHSVIKRLPCTFKTEHLLILHLRGLIVFDIVLLFYYNLFKIVSNYLFSIYQNKMMSVKKLRCPAQEKPKSILIILIDHSLATESLILKAIGWG